MRKDFIIAVLLVLFFLPGCLAKRMPPRVEENVFISETIPRIKIRIDADMPFLRSEKGSPTATDDLGSESTIGVAQERYMFGSKDGMKAFVIEMVSFMGPKNSWEMSPIDFSREPGVLKYGKITIGNDQFDTGVFTLTDNGLKFLSKSYTRLVGQDMRFTITYVEFVLETFANPGDLTLRERTLVDEFSSRADRSFVVLP